MKKYIKLFFAVFLGAIIVIGLFNFEPNMPAIAVYKITLSALATALLWVGSSSVTDILQKRFPWIKMPVLRLVITLFATSLITLIVWWFIVAIWDAPNRGFDAFRAFRNFSLSDFLPTLFITLFISIFMHGRSFLLEWRQAAGEAERLKKEQISARYETLKNQVNPHFLFNSLNVLTELVHKDADQAERFIRQLSAVYRYILDSRDRETVTIEEEIQQLESYFFLLKIRFGDSFNSKIDVQSLDRHIAPLTLQMLVENAVKHNEVSKSKPLFVTIREEQQHLIIENNLQLKQNVSDYSGVGLPNIEARYRFLTDQMVVTEQTTTHFRVKIPII